MKSMKNEARRIVDDFCCERATDLYGPGLKIESTTMNIQLFTRDYLYDERKSSVFFPSLVYSR